MRWWVEEDFQQCKQVAVLDRGQVRTWTSWHRWGTPAPAAHAFLAVTTAVRRASDAEGGGEDQATLVPVSVPELARLPRVFVFRSLCRHPEHVAWWSRWRRHHQHRPMLAHRRWPSYADMTPIP